MHSVERGYCIADLHLGVWSETRRGGDGCGQESPGGRGGEWSRGIQAPQPRVWVIKTFEFTQPRSAPAGLSFAMATIRATDPPRDQFAGLTGTCTIPSGFDPSANKEEVTHDYEAPHSRYSNGRDIVSMRGECSVPPWRAHSRLP